MRRKSGEEDEQQQLGICFSGAMAVVLRRHPHEVLRRGPDGFFGEATTFGLSADVLPARAAIFGGC
jgi:hypothetical protein